METCVKHNQINVTLAQNECLGKVFRRNNSLFVSREILGQLLLVPICRKTSEVAHIYRLNEIGSVVWKHIDGQRTLAQIASLIHDQYDVDVSMAQQDISELSQQLEQIAAVEEVADVATSYP